MPVKTYVLLEHLKPTAPIYQRINENQRIRIDKLPVYGIPLRVAFTDKEGIYRVHRYKAQANSVVQEEQVRDQKIEANAPFTQQEYREREFRDNVLTTTKVGLQKYLESIPYMEGVEGMVDNERTPVYRLLDTAKDIKSSNALFKLRLKVGNMIGDLDLKSAKELLIRLNGSHFATPDDLEECQNLLVDYMNSAELDSDLENMLRQELSSEEKAIILIGNAINKKILSFNQATGEIEKTKGNRKSVVRTIQAENVFEMQRLFAEHITSDAGKALYADIEKDLK